MASAVIAEPAMLPPIAEAARAQCTSTPRTRFQNCLLLLVLLGIGLRAWHYVSDPSVWHDEAALIVNVIGKDFGELLGPLYFAEAAPPLFLAVEKAITLVLGDSTLALRLLPFLASCAGLLLFAGIARRELTPAAALLAVLLFATSDMLSWHACEAKSYGIDVLAAVLLVALTTQPLPARLIAYILLAPPLIFLSFPACFLYGGVLTALLPDVWQSRQRRIWLLYLLLTLTVFTAFALLALGPVRSQRCDLMTSDWLTKFPPWERPWAIPGWLATSTLEIARYSLKPWGQFLAPLAVLGVWQLWRAGRGRIVVLLVVPVLLAAVASFLGAYPYGGSRVLAYAIPGVVLLIAAGAVPAFRWLTVRNRLLAVVLGVLLAMPVGAGLYRALVPWHRADAAGAAAFVLSNRQSADAVVANDWEFTYLFRQLDNDFHLAMGQPFEPGRHLGQRGAAGQFMLQAHDRPAQGERVWVIAKSTGKVTRQAFLDAIPAGTYHIRERREFRRVTVVLLVRAS